MREMGCYIHPISFEEIKIVTGFEKGGGSLEFSIIQQHYL